jgi:hypothetical protein
MAPMSVRMNLPGPFSVRLRGLSLRQQIAQDKKTIQEARDGWRELRALCKRDTEPKKIKKLRRETTRENEKLARQYRRDSTIT